MNAERALKYANEWTAVPYASDVAHALAAEVERLRKVEAAALVVLHFTKDARLGPDGEDATDALAELVRPDVER